MLHRSDIIDAPVKQSPTRKVFDTAKAHRSEQRKQYLTLRNERREHDDLVCRGIPLKPFLSRSIPARERFARPGIRSSYIQEQKGRQTLQVPTIWFKNAMERSYRRIEKDEAAEQFLCNAADLVNLRALYCLLKG